MSDIHGYLDGQRDERERSLVRIAELKAELEQAQTEKRDLQAEIERLRQENIQWAQRNLREVRSEVNLEVNQALQADNERLRAALEDTLIGINHVALYKADNWPEPGTDHMEALEHIGAGQSYDLWCCWNAGMRARRALEGKE